MGISWNGWELGLTFVPNFDYHKNSKNWDTIMIAVIVVKVGLYGFTLSEYLQKGGDGIANSTDPYRTAPYGAV